MTSRFADCGPRGVFVHPRKSRFVGTVIPGAFEVVQVIAKDNGETLLLLGRGNLPLVLVSVTFQKTEPGVLPSP